MVLEFFLFVAVVIVVLVALDKANGHFKKSKSRISFKESMDLTELPVVTFYNNNQKLNFLLDTGSNDSHINMSVLPNLEHEILQYQKNLIGVEGNPIECLFCNMAITYKDQKFEGDFSVTELDDAFNAIKQESGVQIHGILGSKFFQKYRYVLDFDSLIAYLK